MDTMDALIRICISTAFVDGCLSPKEIAGIKKIASRAGAESTLRKILEETSELRHRWQTMDDMLRWLEPALKTIENAPSEVRFMASLMVDRVIAVDDEFDGREQDLARRIQSRIVPDAPPKVLGPKSV